MEYIKAYDDVVTEDWCDSLIEKFESNLNRIRERRPHTDHPNMMYDEINLIDHPDLFEEETKHLLTIFDSMVGHYAKDCDIIKYQWPEKIAWEAFRIKKYVAGTGYFKPHCDAFNLASCNRFLVYFLHLTDGPGGGTHFNKHKVTIPRKKGRLVMFPPTWQYPHEGEMPFENDKYIVGAHLRFAN